MKNLIKKLIETDNEKVDINILLKNKERLNEIQLTDKQVELLLSKNDKSINYSFYLKINLFVVMLMMMNF